MINLAVQYNNLGVDILCGKHRTTNEIETEEDNSTSIDRDELSGEACPKRRRQTFLEEAEKQARREARREAETERQVDDALAHFQKALALIVRDTEHQYQANGLRYHPNDADGFLRYENEAAGRKLVASIQPCDTGIDLEGEGCNNQYIHWKAVKIANTDDDDREEEDEKEDSFSCEQQQHKDDFLLDAYTCDLNDCDEEYDEEDLHMVEESCETNSNTTSTPTTSHDNINNHHQQHHLVTTQQHNVYQQQSQQQQHYPNDQYYHNNAYYPQQQQQQQQQQQPHVVPVQSGSNGQSQAQTNPFQQQPQSPTTTTPPTKEPPQADYQSLAKSIYHSMVCIYNIGLCYQHKGMTAKAKHLKSFHTHSNHPFAYYSAAAAQYRYFLDASVDHYTHAYELMTRFRLEDSAQYTFLMAMMNNLAATYGSLGETSKVDVCNRYLVQSLILVICSSERDGHLGQEVLSRTETKSVLRREEDRATFESFLSNVMYLMLGDGPGGDQRYSGNTAAAAA